MPARGVQSLPSRRPPPPRALDPFPTIRPLPTPLVDDTPFRCHGHQGQPTRACQDGFPPTPSPPAPGAGSHDLVLVADATASMGPFLLSLEASLLQLLPLMRLTGAFRRMRVLAYRDYSDKKVVLASDWSASLDDLKPFIRKLAPTGGGDFPEAAKTAAALLLKWAGDSSRAPGSKMVALWYTDAPPHHPKNRSRNLAPERQFLAAQGQAWDWVQLCRGLAQRHVLALPVLSTACFDTACFYALLADVTGGLALHLPQPSTGLITEVSVGLVLALLGQAQGQGTAELVRARAAAEGLLQGEDRGAGLVQTLRFKVPVPDTVANEWAGNQGYLPGPCPKLQELQCLAEEGFQLKPFGTHADVAQLQRLFDSDEAFCASVFSELEQFLVPARVLGLTRNPLLGSLWRMVCRRRGDGRTRALQLRLNRLLGTLPAWDAGLVRSWLAESYNNTWQVTSWLAQYSGPRLPALTLDTPAEVDTAVMASNLLELTRGVHPRALRQAASLLAHLRLVGAPPTPPLPPAGHAAPDAPCSSAAVHSSSSGADPAEDDASCLEGPSRSSDPGADVSSDTDSDSRSESAGEVAQFLPWGLPNDRFFALLPHLLAPGTVFSRRPAVVVAALALVSGSAVLGARARQFLQEARGTWWAEQDAENYSASLARLMLQASAVPGGEGAAPVLTERELQFFRTVARLAGLQSNRKSRFQVTRGAAAGRKQGGTVTHVVRPDRKRLCQQCGMQRSFTLMTPSGACGPCLEASKRRRLPPPEALGAAESQWLECCSCRGHYAVVALDLLRQWASHPRCFYCRHGQTPPLRQCGASRNRFVDPCLHADGGSASAHAGRGSADQAQADSPPRSPAGASPGAPWVCPPCAADPAKGTETEEASLQELVAENERLILRHVAEIDARAGTDIFESSAFKLMVDKGVRAHQRQPRAQGATVLPPPQAAHAGPDPCRAKPCPDQAISEPPAPPVPPRRQAKEPVLMLGGKEVHNTRQVCREIRGWLDSGQAMAGTCLLCFEDVRLDALEAGCGQGHCRAAACQACLRRWYAAARPGHWLTLGSIQCPFCKSHPPRKQLQRFNRSAAAIQHRTRPGFMGNHRMHYAWCQSCHSVAEWGPKACGREGMAGPTEFVCSSCLLRAAPDGLLLQSKPCPGCDRLGYKESGCDHIYCPFCKVDWCWSCGQQCKDFHHHVCQ